MNNSSDKNLTVLITGGSSGIGRAVCECLAEKNIRVYEFSRTGKSTDQITHYSVDVTNKGSVTEAVNAVLSIEGKIDILINCAGYGIGGAVEFTKEKDAKKQFDVNFFGMANVTAAVLSDMREKCKGRIVNISSVAAPVPIPFQAFYSASKAAINSYTAALANEVRPFGVSVCAVMPGDISTGFTDARKKDPDGDIEYGGRIMKSISKMEKDEREGMSASSCAGYIVRIALKKKVKPYYAVGFSYKLICGLIKLLPSGFANRIIFFLYAK